MTDTFRALQAQTIENAVYSVTLHTHAGHLIALALLAVAAAGGLDVTTAAVRLDQVADFIEALEIVAYLCRVMNPVTHETTDEQRAHTADTWPR
jgi:energy-converting hydrogenase Eha subunit C